MPYYETFWKQGSKKGKYRTKTLTEFHKHIHEAPKTDYASTMMVDETIAWAFGAYAEIIAVTNKENPKKNKPFPEPNKTK